MSLIVFLHAACMVGLLVSLGLIADKRRAFVIWLAVIVTSGLVITGSVLVLLRAVLVTPEAIPFVFIFIASSFLLDGSFFIVAWLLRPRGVTVTGTQYLMAAIWFLAVNSPVVFSPILFSRPMVFTVMDVTRHPVNGAKFSQRPSSGLSFLSILLHGLQIRTREITAGSNGQIHIRLLLLETLEGAISAPGYSDDSIYVARSPWGMGVSVQHHWDTTFLGNLHPLHSWFL
jgi:hypothetical protein